MISKEIVRSYEHNIFEFFEAINQADISETFYYGRRIDRIGKFQNIRYDDFLNAVLKIIPPGTPINLRLQAKIQLLAKKTISNSWTILGICTRIRSYIASFFYDRELALHILLQRLVIKPENHQQGIDSKKDLSAFEGLKEELQAEKEKLETEQEKLNVIIKKRLYLLEEIGAHYKELCLLKSKYQESPNEQLLLQIKNLGVILSKLETENNRVLAPVQQNIQKEIKLCQQKIRLIQKKFL